ncbi:MAG: aryl-sulfate sulfotransferase [Planctomycetota bacterium]
MTADANPSEYRTDRCMPRPPETLGVTCHEPGRCFEGLTLCWSNWGTSAGLVDLDGTVVHRWKLEQGPRWHQVELLDNGHLLVVANEKPYSPRMISRHVLWELDRDSNVVWRSFARCHHDARRLDDGHTLVVANAPAQYRELHDEPLIYDYLQELDADGGVCWNWHFAPHQEELDLPDAPLIGAAHGDWPHINTVESLPTNAAGDLDERFRPGNVLVSPRHLHLIFIIDRDTDRIVWQWGLGEILGQHQPTMLPDGHILLFDNGRGPGPAQPQFRGWSRVVEMDPLSGEIVWEYKTDPPTDFWTPVGSGNQRLGNANTLICAMNWGEPGRVFEVTPDGEIVWEYWNPEGGSFYRAYRYAPDSEALANLNL